MHLLIDPREGSNKLLKDFEGECEEFTLSGGDVAFFGVGPGDAEWFVGIEHKQVGDLVNCIKDGRFAGTQLPEMMKLYDICFLLLEGNYQPNYHNTNFAGDFTLWVPFGGGRGIHYGIAYKAFDNFLNSISVFSALSGKPCIVKRSRDKSETKQIIRDLYEFFQKPWKDHKSMGAHDRTKMSRVQHEINVFEAEVSPEHPDYPKLVLQKSIYQIFRIGWDVAGKLAEAYRNMKSLLLATQKELETGDFGLGKVGAKRIYETLHGHADPEYGTKRKKKVSTAA